jgi:phage terminase large subunit GpA-like protein
MDAFSDPFIERIVFNKGSQIGGTEALLNMMLYAIHQDPSPALVVYPTLELAKYASRKRIRPVIDACPELKAKRPENDDDFTTMEMLFPGMVLTLSGANSPASLASRPCRYVFLDEVNKFPVNSGKEADPISLAMERQNTF